MISVPPVEPPPKNAIAHPTPTKAPPNTDPNNTLISPYWADISKKLLNTPDSTNLTEIEKTGE